MADIETDEPAIRRFVSRLAVTRLSGLFRISPIGTIENDHIRLQNGEMGSVENAKAEIEQFERRFQGTLARRGSHATFDNLGPEAATVLPSPCSGPDAVRAVDQLQARL